MSLQPKRREAASIERHCPHTLARHPSNAQRFGIVKRGFKNSYCDDAVKTATPRSAELISLSGHAINLIHHTRKQSRETPHLDARGSVRSVLDLVYREQGTARLRLGKQARAHRRGSKPAAHILEANIVQDNMTCCKRNIEESLKLQMELSDTLYCRITIVATVLRLQSCE